MLSNPIAAFVEFMDKGGISMYGLLLCSILLVAIAIERFISLRKLSIDSDWLIKQVAIFLQEERPAETLKFLKSLSGIVPRVLEAGMLRFSRSKEEVESALGIAITEQVPQLERFISLLGTISVISPFLGLLGTVLGIIAAFQKVALLGSTGVAVIAEGIYEALFTTAAGLVIAIPAVILYNYFKGRVRTAITEMEVCANRLVEMIELTKARKEFPEDLLPEVYRAKKLAEAAEKNQTGSSIITSIKGDLLDDQVQEG